MGSAFALGADDFVFPTFRELAAALVRGVDPVQYLAVPPWDMARRSLRPTRHPVRRRSASPSPRRSRTRSATRWACGWTAPAACCDRLLRRRRASEGDFHEAANLAGVFRAPAILFCQNNGWAISVPTASQTPGEIWKRAEGYGFPGVRVDGNDVLAVYRVTTRGRRARATPAAGPTLIEALTYRIGAHSTADDAGRYRDEAEVESAGGRSTRSRATARGCVARGHADEAFVAACEAEAEARCRRIRAGVIAQPSRRPSEWMFDWTYAEPPAVARAPARGGARRWLRRSRCPAR